MKGHGVNRLNRRSRVKLLSLLLAAIVVPSSTASAASGSTTRIGTTGARIIFAGDSPAISGNGRFVAFVSSASDLVPGDSNRFADVFVHDRDTGATSRVSVDSADVQANSSSTGPAISADGRFVAFGSTASNLVADDTNGANDIFVHDRQTGDTTRVTVNSAGVQANSSSVGPAISADGRFVAFGSTASNLVADDTNGTTDVFVRDRQAGETKRLSVDSAGLEANSLSLHYAISADGRFVAFDSAASNLVAGDTNRPFDVFVHDRHTGQTSRVSVDSAGVEGSSASGGLLSGGLAISADGRFVAFGSTASNLVADDTNSTEDLFVHDRQAGETRRVSVDSAGREANNFSVGPALSADGRFVAFESMASNLVAADTNETGDIIVHDRQRHETTRVSVASTGLEANSFSLGAAISADGRFVAFHSAASNLVPGDTNGFIDVFLNDRFSDTSPPTLVLPPATTIEATGPAGAIATYTVSATDDQDPNPTVVCSPPSGSTFALGSTSLTCTATDAAGNSVTGSFLVQVVDTTSPTLSLPGTLTVNATSPAGAVVTFGAAATDLVGPTALTCSHASGSTFPIGTTRVVCIATDASGNAASGTFDVTVLSATQQIDNIVTQVKAVNAKEGVADSLDAKLQNVLAALSSAKAGDKVSACNKLDSFINEVRAQTGPGKSLTQADADWLIADAQRIKNVVGCP
jgi:HYR domain